MNEKKMTEKASGLIVQAGEIIKKMVEGNYPPGVQMRAAIALNILTRALYEVNALFSHIDQSQDPKEKKRRSLLTLLTGRKHE